jgi:TfoX/Sxy family transcriptional regulator of competence genes
VAPDDIRELFCVFGPVEVRRMFGGAGIYADGRMFALMSDGVIYLKADEHNAPAFEREQLEPFTYATRTGRRGGCPTDACRTASTTTRTNSRSGRATH